jgi:hypothetical protein
LRRLHGEDVFERVGVSLNEKPHKFLARQESGDWGKVGEINRRANKDALAHELRVLSA